MTNGNEPINAISEEETDRVDDGVKIYTGLTKREYFAAMAMQGCIASGFQTSMEKQAESAVEAADALITQLNKPTTNG